MGQTLWFASRACGLVALAAADRHVSVLGALHTGRAATRRGRGSRCTRCTATWPLLAVAFVAVHVATAIIDPYAGIRWSTPWCPFASTYHPFWTGLGAAALDLLAGARRDQPRAHPAAAAALAGRALRRLRVVAGGAGARARASAARTASLGWVRAVDAACALAVAAAVVVRLRARHPDTDARRGVGLR